jgi:hypothetical protein
MRRAKAGSQKSHATELNPPLKISRQIAFNEVACCRGYCHCLHLKNLVGCNFSDWTGRGQEPVRAMSVQAQAQVR